MQLQNCLEIMNDLKKVAKNFPEVDPLYNLNDLLHKKDVNQTIEEFQKYARGFVFDLYDELADLDAAHCEDIPYLMMELHRVGAVGLDNEYYDYIGTKRFKCISDAQARDVVVKFLNNRIDEFIIRLRETKEEESDRLKEEEAKREQNKKNNKAKIALKSLKEAQKMAEIEKSISALDDKIKELEKAMEV